MEDGATLDELPVGAEGTVVAVRCERAIARRLMEMGVLPGTRVAVVRVAPLGDPIQLRLRSYSLSIRRREAAGIVLSDVREPVAAAAVAEQAPS
ncbi:MAG: ferrous iron transport protein A [Sandaracinaceae bacterium]|nr:ferrous iron transport protein A [Sandaracinaceae bacterium]